MTPLTVLSDEARTVDVTLTQGRALVEPDTLPAAIGWTLKPEGLCRADVCVPVRDQNTLTVDGKLDLERVAEALGRPFALDDGVAAMGEPRATRRLATDNLVAPSFELPDLDGNLHRLEEWRDRKKLLVAFASW